MGCKSGCCGPPVTEPPTTKALSQVDIDSREDQDKAATGPKDEERTIKEQAIDCCASENCEDDKNDRNEGAPDCCRGKISPCCNAACIDRLAMRDCRMSSDDRESERPTLPYVTEDVFANTASAGTGCGSSTRSCDGATDGKPCNKHSISALDRYSATLQALGCLCRTLIAMGQESCCETRGSPAKKLSSRSLLRTSTDSGRSTGSVTKEKIVENRFRLRNSSTESVKSASQSSAKKSCGKACCSVTKPDKDAVPKDKCRKGCCAKDKSNNQQIIAENPNQKLPDDLAGTNGCLDACCSQKPPPEQQPVDQNDSKVAKNSVTTDSCSDFCCTTGRKENPVAKGYPVTKVNNSAANGCSKSCHATKTEDIAGNQFTPTCGSAKERLSTELPRDACGGSCCEKSQGCQIPDDDCCTSNVLEEHQDNKALSIEKPTDVENQTTGKERVVLSISGMTCTGCETKLNRTLATVPAVKELKTSLVLSRAEFNIDLRLGSVNEVIKHLERTTEFKCERIQTQGSSLDLVVDGNTSQFVGQTWPDGVVDMTVLDKNNVRVSFDPKIIGARDLAERSWVPPVKLAPPVVDSSLEAGNKHVRHVGYMTLLSAVLTIPVLVMAWAPIPNNEIAYSSASLALATAVQVVIAGPFYPKAIKALVFSRVIEMDLLIVLSTSAAYIFSVVSFGYLVAGKPLSTGQFFETSTLLVTLIMVGRWVAALARQKAVESISIRSLQAPTAIIVDEKSGTEREIDIRLLQYGDIFKVLPDTRIPTDGTVMTGSSEVDESMLTGESRPVEKYPGSGIIAGSINGSGVMIVRLDRLPGDNTINTIAAMVDEAKLTKPKLQDLADRVASYFVPVVVALTIITFAIWVSVGLTVQGYGGSKATTEAITYAIAVLIVSCPCAIGLAVPMVIVIMSGVAAEKGIIFKSADAIEVAHKTSHVVFDKTGTLTQGKLSVVSKECIDKPSLPLLLGLIENSRHPVSVAVKRHLKNTGIEPFAADETKSLTGKGIEAVVKGQRLKAGNSRWLGLSENPLVCTLLAQGYTVFCFTVNDDLRAVYGLQDELRHDALETVKALHMRGLSVHVVSGDDDEAVQNLATKLNIPRNNVCSRTSPAGKKDYIQTLLGNGNDHKKPVVVFCGDGTNDAVALAQATIGVHVNEGTDVAQSAADVVLMRPALSGIITMIDASRKSVNRIKFNFSWSFVYNTFAVLLVAGAFVNARIPPEYAGLGELVSVLPVILAAVLLRRSKI
ncbi:unnamed protein product [Fusarium venenatum]|uniref:HMA domain-containing protein n=1 Tax=Fusarium venenatum TaxID=56646 RepID=A0A2L2TFL3_9HYPO|nr:uncharacterized protein FVRRES_13033 [Fusarium venenatum]KAH6979603.1 E1-E2 ATPase-domain-containing protein [Fusarium venenatum]CEI40342.1 unnamed protein product [Fusarium venenatum]